MLGTRQAEKAIASTKRSIASKQPNGGRAAAGDLSVQHPPQQKIEKSHLSRGKERKKSAGSLQGVRAGGEVPSPVNLKIQNGPRKDQEEGGLLPNE